MSARMAKLYPIFLTIAINIGIYSSVMIKMMADSMNEDSDKSEKDKISEALLCMSGLGLGEIIGSLIWGRVIDKFSHKTMVLLNILALIVGYSCLILYGALYEFSYGLALLMTFTMGF